MGQVRSPMAPLIEIMSIQFHSTKPVNRHCSKIAINPSSRPPKFNTESCNEWLSLSKALEYSSKVRKGSSCTLAARQHLEVSQGSIPNPKTRLYVVENGMLLQKIIYCIKINFRNNRQTQMHSYK